MGKEVDGKAILHHAYASKMRKSQVSYVALIIGLLALLPNFNNAQPLFENYPEKEERPQVSSGRNLDLMRYLWELQRLQELNQRMKIEEPP